MGNPITIYTVYRHPDIVKGPMGKDISKAGDRIRHARKHARGGKLSQDQLADRCHTDQSTVSGWETKPTKISDLYYEAIEAATGFPATWLREGGPTPSISSAVPSSAEWGRIPWEQALDILQAELDLSLARGQPITRELGRELLLMLRAAKRENDLPKKAQAARG